MENKNQPASKLTKLEYALKKIKTKILIMNHINH